MLGVTPLFSWVSLAIITLSFTVITGKSSSVSKLEHGKAVVCYFGTWSVYRPGKGAFELGDINPKLCSHIVYSFVGLSNDTYSIRNIDAYYDLEENYGKGGFRKATKLKQKFPHVKVLLAVGGWNEGSTNYSDMAADPSKRKAFVESALQYVTSNDFDGLDLDWEFPTERGGRVEDKQNFVALIKELKQALSKKKLMLTAALNASPRIIEKAYDVVEISKNVDLIHLMTYDYHGGWDKRVGPNAPLNSADNLNVESSIKYLIKQGAAVEKLVIGIAAYGHTFIVEDGIEADMKAATIEASFQGPYTRQDGFMGYNEICVELMKESGWQELWDEKSSTPYAINDNKVIAYDNERSVELKVKSSLKYKVGGFMVWSIDTDDFRGECDTEQHKKFPLLRTIHRTIKQYEASPTKPTITAAASTQKIALVTALSMSVLTAFL